MSKRPNPSSSSFPLKMMRLDEDTETQIEESSSQPLEPHHHHSLDTNMEAVEATPATDHDRDQLAEVSQSTVATSMNAEAPSPLSEQNSENQLELLTRIEGQVPFFEREVASIRRAVYQLMVLEAITRNASNEGMTEEMILEFCQSRANLSPHRAAYSPHAVLCSIRRLVQNGALKVSPDGTRYSASGS